MESYGVLAGYYDRIMADMPYMQWLQWLERCFRDFGRPAKIVELGCGTGNISIPLALKGFEVIGIDLSETMLAVADGKAKRLLRRAKDGSCVWLQQDMREWAYPEPVGCVVSFCDSINYLTDPQDVAATFRCVSEGLQPGGLFVFDVLTANALRYYAKNQPYTFDESDLAYIWSSYYTEESAMIEHELTIFAQVEPALFRRITEYHVQRAYPLEFLSAMLEEQGLSVLGQYADFRWKKPTDKANRVFFAARKNG